MTRVSALTVLVVLAADVAVAQDVPLVGQSDHTAMHGCSQGHERSVERALFVLTQHGATASLHVDRSWSSHVVSLSREADGPLHSNASVTQGRDVVTLEGSLVRSAAALDITFTQATHETARWSGAGTLPLGPARTAPTTLRLHCEETSVEVATQGTSRRVQLCHFTSTPSWLSEPNATFPLSTRALIRTVDESETPSFAER